METTINNTRAQVVELSTTGYSVSQIAQMLNVSEGTVSYHRRNEKNGVVSQAPRTVAEPEAEAYAGIQDMTLKVKIMTQDGYSVRGISKSLGVSEGTVSYHRAKPPVVTQLQLF